MSFIRFTRPTPRRPVAAILALSLLLIGCADTSDPDPPADTTQTTAAPATTVQPETGADSDQEPDTPEPPSGMQLPDDFPDDVPLIEGPISSVEATQDQNARHWRIHVRVDDHTEGMLAAQSLLIGGGFEEVAWTEEGSVQGEFVTDVHEVTVMAMRDPDGLFLAYFVSSDL